LQIDRRWYSRLLVIGFLAIGLWSACAGTAAATVEARLAEIEAKLNAPAGINSGDNAWLLVSSALVLMMSAPGLRAYAAAQCGTEPHRNWVAVGGLVRF
jgi:hypothetical protein